MSWYFKEVRICRVSKLRENGKFVFRWGQQPMWLVFLSNFRQAKFKFFHPRSFPKGLPDFKAIYWKKLSCHHLKEYLIFSVAQETFVLLWFKFGPPDFFSRIQWIRAGFSHSKVERQRRQNFTLVFGVGGRSVLETPGKFKLAVANYCIFKEFRSYWSPTP